MQMVVFGVEIIFGDYDPWNFDCSSVRQAIQFDTNPEFFFWVSAFLC